MGRYIMLPKMSLEVRIFLHHSSVPFQAATVEATKVPLSAVQAPTLVARPLLSL